MSHVPASRALFRTSRTRPGSASRLKIEESWSAAGGGRFSAKQDADRRHPRLGLSTRREAHRRRVLGARLPHPPPRLGGGGVARAVHAPDPDGETVGVERHRRLLRVGGRHVDLHRLGWSSLLAASLRNGDESAAAST